MEITSEELKEIMNYAANFTSEVVSDSEGTINGNECELDTIRDGINGFFNKKKDG